MLRPDTYLLLQSAHSLFSGNLRRLSKIWNQKSHGGESHFKLMIPCTLHITRKLFVRPWCWLRKRRQYNNHRALVSILQKTVLISQNVKILFLLTFYFAKIIIDFYGDGIWHKACEYHNNNFKNILQLIENDRQHGYDI